MRTATLSKKLSALLLSALLLLVAAVFFSNPTRYSACVSRGISLWAVSVLPVTFPFLFFSGLASSLPIFRPVAPLYEKLFRISGEGGELALLSAACGYPVGARLVSTTRSFREANGGRLLSLSLLCSTAGPIFLIGVVGTAFGSPSLGWVLLLSHFFGVYAVPFFLRFFLKKYTSTKQASAPRPTIDLYTAVQNAVLSVLCVGGMIALFTLFGQIASDMGIFSAISSLFPPEHGYLVEAFLQGSLEMTTGCLMLAQTPSPVTLSVACFLITFGGLCVIMQQLSYLSKVGVAPLSFCLGKLAQAIVATLVCYPLSLLVFYQ